MHKLILPLAMLSLAGCDTLAIGDLDQQYTELEKKGASKAELCAVAEKALALIEDKSGEDGLSSEKNLSYWWRTRSYQNCAVAPSGMGSS